MGMTDSTLDALIVFAGLSAILIAFRLLDALLPDASGRKPSRSGLGFARRTALRALTPLPRTGAATPDWLPRRVFRRIEEGFSLRAPDRRAALRAARAPFGWPLLDASLTFSVVAAIIVHLVAWIATGETWRVGALTMLPPDAGAQTRFSAAVGFAAALGVGAFAPRIGPALQIFLLMTMMLSDVVEVAALALFALFFALIGSGVFAVSGATALAVVGAVAGPDPGLAEFAGPLAFALACTLAAATLIRRGADGRLVLLGLAAALMAVLAGAALADARAAGSAAVPLAAGLLIWLAVGVGRRFAAR